MTLFSNSPRIANAESLLDSSRNHEPASTCVGLGNCVMDRGTLRDILLSRGTAQQLPDGGVQEGVPLNGGAPTGPELKFKPKQKPLSPGEPVGPGAAKGEKPLKEKPGHHSGEYQQGEPLGFDPNQTDSRLFIGGSKVKPISPGRPVDPGAAKGEKPLKEKPGHHSGEFQQGELLGFDPNRTDSRLFTGGSIEASAGRVAGARDNTMQRFEEQQNRLRDHARSIRDAFFGGRSEE
ncbi:MAG: hypothetical protein IT290_10505 [Deltaproteobacteria bacterium]|nr:hypothetical protein [Deltaproteobacteria bacterium]